jgi:hypothetical protein
VSASPPPAVLHATVVRHDLSADIRLAPALVGRSQLVVVLHDRAGHPVDDATISANIDMSSMSMDPAFHAMHGASAGTYTESVQLTMPGHWRIELRVKRPGRATETIDAPVFIDIP